MNNIVELVAQIRFQLFQLASNNAHHEFEHLCRHLARARICSNILPATGPVSSGGDQGKDFETYRTYLQKNLENKAFLGLVADKPLAFACTIQVKTIDKKIQSDVKKILAGDSKIEGIYYFLTQDVPVAQRHKLQKWCDDNYSTNLEIFDGQAIAEMLSEYDVFWIAEKYLSIPNDLYPKREDNENWYTKLLRKWKTDQQEDLNYSDFFEIKSAIREATFNSKYRSDLLLWIKKLKIFKDNSVVSLKRKAIYEIVVASLRGLNTLECSFEDIDSYFETISEITAPYDIDEAETLITYCIGAQRHNVFNYDAKKLMNYREILNRRIEERLKAEKSLTNICSLFEIRGFTYISSNPVGEDNPNFDEAIKYWNKVADLAGDCPLFPLERFIDRITSITGIFHNRLNNYFDKLELLNDRLDSLLEKRSGEFVVAQKAKERALKYYSNGAITRAIKQLHIAKVNWFAEETLKGSVISCLMIASWYKELHLTLAAKYYYLAVAQIILSSTKPELNKYFAEALVRLAEIEYLDGRWCNCIDFTEVGLLGYSIFSDRSIIKEDGSDELSRIIYHTSILLTLTKQLRPEIHKSFLDIIEQWDLQEYFSKALPMAEGKFIFKDENQLWSEIQANFHFVPLNDLGIKRTILWMELGVEWELSFDNDYHTVPIAEQFVAIAQVLLCDLFSKDLFLLKTKVSMRLSVGENIKYNISPEPSNKGREWVIKFPYYSEISKTNFDDIQTFCIAAITEILSEVSLKPRKDFMSIIEQSFKEGLSLKIFIAQPYEIIYRNIISLEIFNRIPKHSFEPPVSPNSSPLPFHSELSWKSDLAETYSLENSREALNNRYMYLSQYLRFTLPKLLKSKEFCDIIPKFKERGWKDWHILNAIAGITLNYRTEQLTELKTNLEKLQRYTLEKVRMPEEENEKIPPASIFTEEKMINQNELNSLSTMRMLGLDCSQLTPDLEAIDTFLRYRFNHYKDDIEHEDFFKI